MELRPHPLNQGFEWRDHTGLRRRLSEEQVRAHDELGFFVLENAVPEPVVDEVAAPVGKGGIVVFSSLIPHATGANTTKAVRKAYIVQFAPASARMYPRGPDGSNVSGGDGIRCDAPDRQVPVLLGGEAPADPIVRGASGIG